MSKLNSGNSHLSIGQYMSQAGWPGVGRVRKIFRYDDSEIQPLTSLDCDADDRYDMESPYNSEDGESHVDYVNKNRFYRLLYRLAGHKTDMYDNILPIISTLDNPELLVSPTHKRYDPNAVEDGSGLKHKLTQGWQQFRGSFEPMRKSLKGLTKVFARYKSPHEAIHNDALGFVFGAGNVVEGVTQIVLVPFFLIFRLLKNLGLLVRHPFTGASYKNLVVRFARDVGYSGTWLIEGALETVQGVIRIVMQVPKWFIQMPIRGIRTGVVGYTTFAENAGTRTLIFFANQQVNADLVARCKQSNGNNVNVFEGVAEKAFDKFIETVGFDGGGNLVNNDWNYLQNEIAKLSSFDWCDATWHNFCVAGGHRGKSGSTPDFYRLVYCCFESKVVPESYASAKKNVCRYSKGWFAAALSRKYFEYARDII